MASGANNLSVGSFKPMGSHVLADGNLIESLWSSWAFQPTVLSCSVEAHSDVAAYAASVPVPKSKLSSEFEAIMEQSESVQMAPPCSTSFSNSDFNSSSGKFG